MSIDPVLSVNPTPSQSGSTPTKPSAPSSTISAEPAQSKPTNFEYNRWDKTPLKDKNQYTYKYAGNDGKEYTITQTWSNKYSDEFIVGCMRALAEQYVNSPPEIRKIIQDKLSRGEEPHFVEVLAPVEKKEDPRQTIGYMITWPPDENEADGKYFTFNRDEYGTYYMQTLDTVPAQKDLFKEEVVQVFFNRDDRFPGSFLHRLTKKVDHAARPQFEGRSPGFITFPHEKFRKNEGQIAGGSASIQSKIAEIAEYLKKIPKPVVTAEQISSGNTSPQTGPTLSMKKIDIQPSTGGSGSPKDD